MTRGIAFGVLVAVSGGAMFLTRPADGIRKDEAWMEKNLPPTVENYHFLPSVANAQQSYRMSEDSYKQLRPYGIVCRKYTDGTRTFDVVVIASNSRASFHDPRVCFTVQGWNIQKESRVSFDYKGKQIPFTLCDMVGADRSMGQSLAMYFYKGASGYYPNTAGLKLGMFIDSIKGGSRTDGVFYRIIPEYPGATQDDIALFAAKYKDAAAAYSHGYF